MGIVLLLINQSNITTNTSMTYCSLQQKIHTKHQIIWITVRFSFTKWRFKRIFCDSHKSESFALFLVLFLNLFESGVLSIHNMPSNDSERNAKCQKTRTFASILIFNRLQVIRAALHSTHVFTNCVLSRTFFWLVLYLAVLRLLVYERFYDLFTQSESRRRC